VIYKYGRYADNETHNLFHRLKSQRPRKEQAQSVVDDVISQECIRRRPSTYASPEWISMSKSLSGWWVPRCRKDKLAAIGLGEAVVKGGLPLWIVIVIAAVGLLVVIIGVVGIILWRRRNSSNAGGVVLDDLLNHN
jgi:hypothetical protein